MDTTATVACHSNIPNIASLRIDDDAPEQKPSRPALPPLQQPDNIRPTSEPSPTSPVPTYLQPRPRNSSPYSRGHLRSQSANNISPSSSVTRTRSLPSVPHPSMFARSPSHSPVRSPSPLRPPSAARISPRRSFEEAYPHQPPSIPSFMDIESIAEDSELDLTPKNQPPKDSQNSPTPPAMYSNTFPRTSASRRRPTSPLPNSRPPQTAPATTSHPRSSSPSSIQSGRFNEPFPGQSSGLSISLSATSSNPSTPTSFRSRSPSISSLETIPDTPDAEEAAVEAHHLARLKAAADAVEAAEAEVETEKRLRAAGLAAPEGRSAGHGLGLQTLKDKRKRWSVCGAERRGDFEMETIWED